MSTSYPNLHLEMYSEGRLRSMEKIIQKEKKEDFNFHLYKCFIHFVLIKKDFFLSEYVVIHDLNCYYNCKKYSNAFSFTISFMSRYSL
jgi:hypothetical protein